MRKIIRKLNIFRKVSPQFSKDELADFVGDQFRELLKKNLTVPVKFYHL